MQGRGGSTQNSQSSANSNKHVVIVREAKKRVGNRGVLIGQVKRIHPHTHSGAACLRVCKRDCGKGFGLARMAFAAGEAP